MNQIGFYCRSKNGITLMQCSIWDILTDEEDNYIREFIKKIAKRNPGHEVKVTFEMEERCNDLLNGKEGN
ncbi:MAG: hypothetical protein HFG41_05970 [Coprococcus sp.]|nr:hypothetical protein [Coprococcus sp.]